MYYFDAIFLHLVAWKLAWMYFNSPLVKWQRSAFSKKEITITILKARYFTAPFLISALVHRPLR